MTVNIAEARTLVERLREFHLNVRGTLEMDAADTIAALLDKVEHWKAEAESWEKQASDRVDDALKFAAERDALARDAARYRHLAETTTFTDVIERAYSTGLTYHVRRWFHDSNDQFDTLDETIDAEMKGASDE